MQTIWSDLKYTFRQLRKSPGFTVTIVLTLALGIGANSAVFTLFDQALIRMLPVQKPKELVRFEWRGSFSGSSSSFGGSSYNYFSYPMYKDLSDRNQVFLGVAAADHARVGVSWHNQADETEAEVVSGNYFQLLGLKPALGRLLSPEDDTAKNANPVLVLSYSYWRSRFSSSRDVIGQTALINGHAFTILGVAPENFRSAIGGFNPSVFVPVSMVDIAIPWMAPHDNLNNHKAIWLTLFARLKPGISSSQAQASLNPLWHSLRAQEFTLYQSSSQRFKEGFVDKSELIVLDDSRGFSPNRAQLKAPLEILMSMSGLLVVMCAINVATLLLLRSATRTREMSMRYALGAQRGRIVSQLLIEGGTLGAAGAIAGLAMAPSMAKILVHIMTNADPGGEPYSAAIDLRILLFSLALSIAVSLVFSIAPIFHFLRSDLAGSIRQNVETATKQAQRFRKLAVGTQIAFSVILLGCAGLFVHTLGKLYHQSVGFDADHLIEFNITPSNSGYGEDRAAQVMMNVLEIVRRLPGIEQAAGTTDPELYGNSESAGFSVQGYTPAENEDLSFETPWITPGYFPSLHQSLLAGRDFTNADTRGAASVAIVNASFAKRFFGSPQNALGRLVGSSGKPDTMIVGVVGDVKHRDLRTEIGPAVYRPYLQDKHPGGMEIYARTLLSPENVETAIRKSIHQFNPLLVVNDLRTMTDQIKISAENERTIAILAICFSVLAMLLAAVGLYGVIAYSANQRTREIAVRFALGAKRSEIVLLVAREMILIATLAIVVALPAVVALARLFQNQLYQVPAFDLISLVTAFVLTAVMIALAAADPIIRAASVEPIRVLHTD